MILYAVHTGDDFNEKYALLDSPDHTRFKKLFKVFFVLIF